MGLLPNHLPKFRFTDSMHKWAKTLRHWCLEIQKGFFDLAIARRQESKISQICLSQKAKVRSFYVAGE